MQQRAAAQRALLLLRFTVKRNYCLLRAKKSGIKRNERNLGEDLQ